MKSYKSNGCTGLWHVTFMRKAQLQSNLFNKQISSIPSYNRLILGCRVPEWVNQNVNTDWPMNQWATGRLFQLWRLTRRWQVLSLTLIAHLPPDQWESSPISLHQLTTSCVGAATGTRSGSVQLLLTFFRTSFSFPSHTHSHYHSRSKTWIIFFVQKVLTRWTESVNKVNRKF